MGVVTETVPGYERSAGPLRLRRPRRDDVDAYIRLHTDPRTYAHAPETMPDAIRCRIRLDEDLEHWESYGFGYLAVEEEATGLVVGWGGVRSFPDHDSLNLYYRLQHASLGRGWGRLIAQTVTVAATEVLSDRVVRASIRPVNAASIRTVLAAGLVRIGTEAHATDPAEGPESELFELPKVRRVTDASGGVRAVIGVLTAPDGTALGLGWCHADDVPRPDLASLIRLHVDPDLGGRNFDRLLLAGMQAILGGMDWPSSGS